ncbi:Hint domain-containing protein [Nereida sp. MMG025]|uniref:Hint domain-containing protein n=1 Tax=Nereida sp. MMG025 TaxID=2909981 RepID=UPI001F42918E|nr:Hint domain-containing protein [Nereida sp. MMG025]MCF6446095.1 hypothetical protein [Nereida sp. MMG025]
MNVTEMISSYNYKETVVPIVDAPWLPPAASTIGNIAVLSSALERVNNGEHIAVRILVEEKYGPSQGNSGYSDNAFAHMFASAHIAFFAGAGTAAFAGNWREFRPNNTIDSATFDQYNNYIGRVIGDYLRETSQEFTLDNVAAIIGQFNAEGLIVNGSVDLANRGFEFPTDSGEVDDHRIHVRISEFLVSKGFQVNNEEQCFPAGTPITLTDGTTKPIQHITQSDVVLAHDAQGNPTAGIVDKLFTNTTSEFIRLTFDDGRDDLVATPGHRFSMFPKSVTQSNQFS